MTPDMLGFLALMLLSVLGPALLLLCPYDTTEKDDRS